MFRFWGKRRGSGEPAAKATGDARHALGLRGEEVAEAHLASLGYKTMDRRYSGPMGELDLVMRDGAAIVFVEVKTLSSEKVSEPQERVTRDKQRKLIRAAKTYLLDKRLTKQPCRFDVVAVTNAANAPPKIRHYRDAFPGE